MKGVIISIFIAVGIIAGSIVYTNHIGTVSRELGKLNDSVIDALISEDYANAASGTDALTAYLDRKRTILAATGNHEEFDKIEMNISELSEYINGGEQTDALSRCRVLAFLFEHLPKNYELKMENIL